MATETIVHPPRTMMEIFKGLPEGTLVQLINNQLIMSSAPSNTHRKVLGKIFKTWMISRSKMIQEKC